MNTYRDLNIWKKAMELAKLVYELVKAFPEQERNGLVSPLKRAAISKPSNIAEGAGRNSNKEFVHFLSITNGSTSELKTQLLLATELQLMAQETNVPLLHLCLEIKNMNFALHKSLRKP